MDKQTKIARWVLAGACIMILLLLAMACLSIHLAGVGFSWETVAERLRIIAPTLIAAAVIGLIALFICLNGRKEEKAKGGKELYKAPKDGKKSGKTRNFMLALALVLIVLGAINGGARDVFVKAVNICTECIGLG